MKPMSVKEEAQRLIEDLGEDATWDDLMYRIYVRQSIEAGLRDSADSRTVNVKEIRTQFCPQSLG
jgi:hypothetical protein